ncbi:MAG: ribonuclease HII [Chloroflexi bacterium]|nr:MAG: ribonuclease HII [Chloroflexota bacterium]
MTRQFNPAEIPAMPDLSFESRLWDSGAIHIAGLDEAGRGAWAGPVAAGAVILPLDPKIADQLSGVRDSKQMTPADRTYWAEIIRTRALAWGVGFSTNVEIDELGIVPATRLAMTRALEGAYPPGCPPFPADHLLIDALRLPDVPLPQTALIKGDARSLSIAAASILAKTARDALMVEFDEEYPAYGFARHKGYGTSSHWQALQIVGPCKIHRFSFEPVRLVSCGQVK